MTKLNKKGCLPNYIGGQPPSPRDLAHKGPMHDERQCQDQPTLPHASVTSYGAQVASQHCPILLTGMRDSIKIDQNFKLAIIENQKMEVENCIQKLGKYCSDNPSEIDS